MRDLEDIRGRCRMEDGHWIWAGAIRADGRPNVHAPDHTRGGMRAQSGARAVVHCSTGKPIPSGWRAYGTCDEPLCLNPAHIRCASMKKQGAFIASTGRFKGQTRRIIANRATLLKRTVLSPELIAEIQASEETGVALARRLGIGDSTVSKARRGESVLHRPRGIFSALLAAPRDQSKARG